MKNSEIYLLYSCDAWHTYSSMKLLGVFDNMNTMAENYLTSLLSVEEVAEILENSQTQGRETNYIILTEPLNPTL